MAAARRSTSPVIGRVGWSRLAACLVARRRAGLHELAAALDVSVPAVREGLAALGDRLARVGLSAVVGGVDASSALWP